MLALQPRQHLRKEKKKKTNRPDKRRLYKQYQVIWSFLFVLKKHHTHTPPTHQNTTTTTTLGDPKMDLIFLSQKLYQAGRDHECLSTTGTCIPQSWHCPLLLLAFHNCSTDSPCKRCQLADNSSSEFRWHTCSPNKPGFSGAVRAWFFGKVT